jgi:glycerol-3-phosphate dehydrogenase (NAD(P)+)
MKLGVLGAGAWGTALAIAAGRAGSDVCLFSRSGTVADDINNKHLSPKYLGHIAIHQQINATCNIADIFNSDAILLAVPAQNLRAVCMEIAAKTNAPLVICAKGVEQASLALMSEIVQECCPQNLIGIVSGPNFADEVAKGLPACATLASKDAAVAEKIIKMLGHKLFRLYYSDDVIGAQIGGAVKNVLAIACGIAIGSGFGENARAALVTRGISEMGRLSVRLGGRQETLLGLSGVGDIMLTCASEKSRNMSLGMEIGKGRDISAILKAGKTVEGVATSKSVALLAEKMGVDMPITNAVKAILHEQASVANTVEYLLERPVLAES